MITLKYRTNERNENILTINRGAINMLKQVE